ncbi:MAG: S8 family serine peptidase [Acidimicrobiales bacterium]
MVGGAVLTAAAVVLASVSPALGLAAPMGGGRVRPALANADEFFDQQWSLAQIGAPAAWTANTADGVIIGVVDTGVDIEHPDLAGKVVATANCLGRRPCSVGGGQDDNGHGTIVAGIAAAVTGNGIGVAGAAPGARLVVAKALDSTGTGNSDDIRAAIDWVVSQGASVVNLSVGEDGTPAAGPGGGALRTAIESAWARGVVPVLASGNRSGAAGTSGSMNYGDLNALVVGATDRSGAVASYSASLGNAKWGLVAPGGSGSGDRADNIYSTGLRSISPYVAAAGTSMAAPHVAATVAILRARGLSPAESVARVLASSDRVGCGTGCQGRLNMAAAVDAPPTPAPVIPPPTTSPRPATPRPPAPVPVTTLPAAPVTTIPAIRILPPGDAPPAQGLIPGIELPFVAPAQADGPQGLSAPSFTAPGARPGLTAPTQGVAGTLLGLNLVLLVAALVRRQRDRSATAGAGW